MTNACSTEIKKLFVVLIILCFFACEIAIVL